VTFGGKLWSDRSSTLRIGKSKNTSYFDGA
jgi:hypothetical protein